MLLHSMNLRFYFLSMSYPLNIVGKKKTESSLFDFSSIINSHKRKISDYDTLLQVRLKFQSSQVFQNRNTTAFLRLAKEKHFSHFFIESNKKDKKGSGSNCATKELETIQNSRIFFFFQYQFSESNNCILIRITD